MRKRLKIMNRKIYVHKRELVPTRAKKIKGLRLENFSIVALSMLLRKSSNLDTKIEIKKIKLFEFTLNIIYRHVFSKF